jgi:hypothetical protein
MIFTRYLPPLSSLAPFRAFGQVLLIAAKFAPAFAIALCWFSPVSAQMSWSGDTGPWGPGPMNQTVQTWNTFANYNYHIPVYYSSGIPTAQANYMGSIGFGGQGNYRVAMHESAHWMGTGTQWRWNNHFRWGVWNGTYATHLRRAWDGPGERQFGDGMHYWPDGANQDSEGVNGPRFVGLVGAFRRDMNLDGGDQTIGIASGTYRLRHRSTTRMLDSAGAFADGAQPAQRENGPSIGQRWEVNLISGTRHFTLRNVANGKYLDSLGSTVDGSPVGMTSLASGAPSDSQLWEIVATDSFFFKIVNKANGKALDNLGAAEEGAGLSQWNARNNWSWNQQWTFVHPLVQSAPPAGVISQGRPVASSSTQGNHYDLKGNNGVSGDRWNASSGSFPQWWQVDTGSVQPLTRVEVDWITDGGRRYQYRIEVSDNGSSWTVAANRTNNTVSGTTVDFLTGITGRFVRVTITGSSAGWAAFTECRVYNEAEPMKLLSLFRPTTASSEQTGNLAVNANDVDPVFTRWAAGSSSYPAWWQVDLGEPKQVNRAVIQWFDDDTRSYQYRIEGSTDGVNFTTLIDRTNNTAPSTTSDVFSGVARWVRITVTGGSHGWASIYDVQIYGAAILAPTELAASVEGDNITLSWAAAQGATSYSVMRATVSGGPYTTVATGVTGTGYTDSGASGSATCYYVVASAGEGIVGEKSAELRVNLPGTVAYWNFEDGVASQSFTPSGSANGSGGSRDTVSGILMRGWNSAFGPTWTSAAPPNGGVLAANFANNAQDGYVTEGALHGWSPAAWTIETTVFLRGISGWRTLIGRDGSSQGAPESDFYFSNNGVDNRFRINIATVGGQRWILDGNYPVQTNTWYALAARSDGTTLSLWLDDGTGYQQIGSRDISAQTAAQNALPGTHFSWTFGRGWYNGSLVDQVDGRMDNIRFSNGALAPHQLIPLAPPPAPAAPSGLAAVTASATAIDLSWNASAGATGYTVKRSATSGGPYTEIASGIDDTSFRDEGLSSGSTYYYVVNATAGSGVSPDSAEVPARTWSPTESWRQAQFGTTANEADAADGADPDGDGVINLLERAFGGDPNRPDASVLPSVEPEAPLLSITYRRAVAASDLTFTVMESTNLTGGWTPATGSSEIIDDDGTIQRIRFTRAAGTADRLFLRVDVAPAP